MRLDHRFTVPAPLDEVWQAVVDPERVAPCLPGATLTEVDGDAFSGTVKVKLGPISLTYKGKGEFLEKDALTGKVVIKAAGKDARGAGTASATVTVTLREENGGTVGEVATDLKVTGRPAQFGRGMIAEVGGKILDTFAECLGQELGSPADSPDPAAEEPQAGGEPEVGAVATPQAVVAGEAETERPRLRAVEPQPEVEPIDLVDYAGRSVAKRVGPLVFVGAVVAAVVFVIRARRR